VLYRYSTNLGTKQKKPKFLPPFAGTCHQIAGICHIQPIRKAGVWPLVGTESRVLKDRLKTNGRQDAGGFGRSGAQSPQSLRKCPAPAEEKPDKGRCFPEEKGGFPERFPKSSRTKGWFSRTNPEQVPNKARRKPGKTAKNPAMGCEALRETGGTGLPAVPDVSATCLPAVFNLCRKMSQARPKRCSSKERFGFYLM